MSSQTSKREIAASGFSRASAETAFAVYYGIADRLGQGSPAGSLHMVYSARRFGKHLIGMSSSAIALQLVGLDSFVALLLLVVARVIQCYQFGRCKVTREATTQSRRCPFCR